MARKGSVVQVPFPHGNAAQQLLLRRDLKVPLR